MPRIADWIRRQGLVPVPAGVPLTQLAPPCDLTTALMSTTETRPAGQSPVNQTPGTGPGAPAPKRNTPTGPSRRTFLRTAWLVSSVGFVSAFAGSTIAFLWPSNRGGFGADIDVDSEEAILAYIDENGGPFPYPAGRMWITRYDPALDPEGVYSEVVAEGSQVMALYQKCVHLGCRVPWNETQGRFACPCHGSNYNFWGEYILGPAPRGLDRFPTRTENGRVFVNTNPATLVTGPSRDTKLFPQDNV